MIRRVCWYLIGLLAAYTAALVSGLILLTVGGGRWQFDSIPAWYWVLSLIVVTVLAFLIGLFAGRKRSMGWLGQLLVLLPMLLLYAGAARLFCFLVTDEFWSKIFLPSFLVGVWMLLGRIENAVKLLCGLLILLLLYHFGWRRGRPVE